MQDIAVQMLASKLSGHDYTATDIASVVITGMSVVFIGLILLVLFVSIYGTAFKRKNEKKKAKLEAEKAAAKAAQQTAAPAADINKTPAPVRPVAAAVSQNTAPKPANIAQQNELIAQSYEICCVVTEHNVLVGDE